MRMNIFLYICIYICIRVSKCIRFIFSVDDDGMSIYEIERNKNIDVEI